MQEQKRSISKVGDSKRGNVRAKRVISKVLDFQFGQNKSAQFQFQSGTCRLGTAVASWPDMHMTHQFATHAKFVSHCSSNHFSINLLQFLDDAHHLPCSGFYFAEATHLVHDCLLAACPTACRQAFLFFLLLSFYHTIKHLNEN
jgi:hypothetical protein